MQNISCAALSAFLLRSAHTHTPKAMRATPESYSAHSAMIPAEIPTHSHTFRSISTHSHTFSTHSDAPSRSPAFRHTFLLIFPRSIPQTISEAFPLYTAFPHVDHLHILTHSYLFPDIPMRSHTFSQTPMHSYAFPRSRMHS